jgi:hypothetical protein
MRAIQWSGQPLPGQAQQRLLVTRSGQLYLVHMPFYAEAGVIDPEGTAGERSRAVDDPAQVWHSVQTPVEIGSDFSYRRQPAGVSQRPAVQDGHRADVHRRLRSLHGEVDQVGDAQPVHARPVQSAGGACVRTLRCCFTGGVIASRTRMTPTQPYRNSRKDSPGR